MLRAVDILWISELFAVLIAWAAVCMFVVAVIMNAVEKRRERKDGKKE